MWPLGINSRGDRKKYPASTHECCGVSLKTRSISQIPELKSSSENDEQQLRVSLDKEAKKIRVFTYK
ncbi:MAG: hypothetical protein N0E54_14635, partial [Candidatus Thiodiazotropha taylori]|nr:hypothetical protein [Candidatus Thiodiazotropha endolucinida]MCW4229972.1 hypothetical protein [Candidatus Thiodiazotropha taylori]